MDECTEKAQWPGEPDDVSPDERDAFLAHVAVCAFHAEKLLLRDEEWRSKFRPARGLDSRGRILRGKELKDTVAERRRGQLRWKESLLKEGPPFKRIYLSNCGENIASSGQFYDFRRYEGDHPLDPQAGLQIWGVFDHEGKTDETLVGYYPLVGVRHTGEEQFIPLDNGYIVGLKVVQLSEWLFNIEFRCVEFEALVKEWTESPAHGEPKEKAAGAAAGGDAHSFPASFNHRVRKCLSWLTPARERLVPQVVVGVVAFLFITATVKGMMLLSNNRDTTTERHVLTVKTTDEGGACAGHDASAATTEKVTSDETNKGEGKGPRQGHKASTLPASAPRARPAQVKPPRAGPTEGLEASKADGKGRPASQQAAALPAGSDSAAQGGGLGVGRRQVWRLQSSLSGGGNVTWIVVHTGMDDALKEKLLAEIRRRNCTVFLLGEGVAESDSPQPLMIAWDISRNEKFVTVQAVLKANGESKILSFRSEGDCTEQACNRAVRDAVSGVFAIMQRLVVPEPAAGV
ncbi:MAG TPA: hypothetical protein VGC87_03770 [Pyrinomonadaceae bacterium]|jgi:hypothetical protein